MIKAIRRNPSVDIIVHDLPVIYVSPKDTDQVIRGMAADWCRVVTLRQPASETGLRAVGPAAERALEIARAY